MTNAIFTQLLKEKISTFSRSYTTLSKGLFYSSDNRNHLTHPGEFGMYRESLVKEFIQLFIPERLGVGTGFAINASDEVSSQLDIVVFDKDVSPKIENESRQRFFPIECICCVGEVKSVLRTKVELSDALSRLSRVKEMAAKVDPRRKPIAAPFTFLFCESIEGTPETIESWFVDAYQQSGVSKRMWHNEIATINSGLFKYVTVSDIDASGTIIPKMGIMADPFLRDDILIENFHLISKDDGGHLISFGHDLVIDVSGRKGVRPDLISYTGEYK